LESVGYAPIETDVSSLLAYSAEGIQTCSEGEVAVVVDVQRGRYIANVGVVFPAAMLEQMDVALLADATITSVLQIFEGGLGDAYRSELR